MIDLNHYSVQNNMHVALRVCQELGVDPYESATSDFQPRWKVVARDLVVEAIKLRAMGLYPSNVVL